MDVSIVQIILVFLVTFIAAIDQFDLLESLYQPIVTGAVIGAILGDVNTGLVVGGTYQLMTIGNMPIGGAQPPNAVIGGIMAAVFACTLDMDANLAVATAIPFALLGQYGVTLFFTLRAPLLEYFRAAAEKADTKAITKWTVVSEVILGLIFAAIVTLFFIGGQTFGQTVVDAIPEWLNNGLTAAGNMMKFVGFAILLKVMMSRDMWAFFLMGFGLAVIGASITTIGSSAILLVLTFIGFGIAFWDFQQQTELKGAVDGGDFSDGI